MKPDKMKAIWQNKIFDILSLLWKLLYSHSSLITIGCIGLDYGMSLDLEQSVIIWTSLM